MAAALAAGLAAGGPWGAAAAKAADIPTTTKLDPSAWNFGSVKVGAQSWSHSFRTPQISASSASVRLEGADRAQFGTGKATCDEKGYDDVLRVYVCTVEAFFAPTTAGSRKATLSLVAGTTRYTATLTATAPAEPVLSVSPSSLGFGPVDVTTASPTLTVTVSNTGSASAPLTITSDGSDFIADLSDCTRRSLPPSEKCGIGVRFVPAQDGPRAGTLRIATPTREVDLRVSLAGTGTVPTAAVAVSPEKVPFGDVLVGALGTARSVSVVNVGRQPVDVTSIAQRGDGDFSVSGGTCRKDTRIDPGGTCDVQLSFTPAAASGRAATIRISFSGGVEPREVSLTGQGISPGQTTTTTTTPDPGPDREPGQPSLAVDPGETRAGRTAAVRGEGFAGDIRLYWDVREDRNLLASLPADGNGRIDTPVVVPADAVVGAHSILACDATACTSAGIVLVSATSAPWGRVAIVVVAGLVVGAVVRAGARRRGQGGKGGGDDANPDPLLRPGERAVRTGFSTADDPFNSVDETQPLVPGQAYFFWLELGPPVAPTLSTRTLTLDAALFGYEGEFGIVATTGSLDLAPDGTARASAQPAGGRDPGPRLLFPVRAPDRPGTHRVRCNLYREQVLLQSWVVSATVAERRRGRRRPRPTVTRQRDFVLARSLDPAYLEQLAPHRLSLLLNDSGEGQHTLRLFGEGGFESSAAIGASELGQLATELHAVLEEVACDRTGGGLPRDRYDGSPDRARLEADLIRLARFGFRAHAGLVTRLGAGAPGTERNARRRLNVLLRAPGRLQVANRQRATETVPAAFLYDHPLDTARSELALCPTFSAVLEAGAPLESSACFHGACPSHGDLGVVCPSGFWGYRHVIGVPQSLGDAGGPLDAPLHAGTEADNAIPAGVSTDPGFRRRDTHLAALRALDPGRPWNVFDTRQSFLAGVGTTDPALVYLYCHGGTGASTAYIQVGALDEDVITPAELAAYDIDWESHPLVFVNGCNTAAVGPETPLQLVSALVELSNAAGVVGTQVTVFEPLACAFAEAFLDKLLVQGESVGNAVRAARLSLLAAGNPLGLVYTPYVSDEVRVPRRPTTVSSSPRWEHA